MREVMCCPSFDLGLYGAERKVPRNALIVGGGENVNTFIGLWYT